MNYRELGNTGLLVSAVGFGGVPINRVEPDRATATLLRAFELGINFVDSARSYGDSEDKIGLALQQYEASDDIIVATKARALDADTMRTKIDRSLAALQTDHIHIYQLHDLREGQLEKVTAPGGALQALDRARQQGKISHIGLSGHHPEALIPAMRSGLFETVQMPLNVIDYPLFADNIPIATELSLGIVVMKPLCGGLMESPERALRFVLSHPVSTAIPGMDCPEQVEENAAVGCEQIQLSDKDRSKLKDEARRLGKDFCRRCGYCQRCPAGLRIPDIFRFERYHSSYFMQDWAKEQYAGLESDVTSCIECGECEKMCPYDLPVREKLQQAHQHLRG